MSDTVTFRGYILWIYWIWLGTGEQIILKDLAQDQYQTLWTEIRKAVFMSVGVIESLGIRGLLEIITWAGWTHGFVLKGVKRQKVSALGDKSSDKNNQTNDIN